MAKRTRASTARAAKKQKQNGTGAVQKTEVIEITALPEPYTPLLADEFSTQAALVVSLALYNNLVPLLASWTHTVAGLDLASEPAARQMAQGLLKCFKHLLQQNAMDPQGKSEKKQVVAKWLAARYSQYLDTLLRLVREPAPDHESLLFDALDAMLALVKVEAAALGEFPQELYERLVSLVLQSSAGTAVASVVAVAFNEKFQQYWDLQAHFFSGSVAQAILSWQLPLVFGNYLAVVQSGLLYSDDDEKLATSPLWTKLAAEPVPEFKNQYQQVLEAVLATTEFQPGQYRQLLAVLHTRIIPYMAVPASLMDFLTDACDQEEDQVVPVLALNALYELMKHHNLEYPGFYAKLYSMLTPELMRTRYRLRFFRLCDLFLSSTHLAASLVASFIKRLARLSLTAPTPAVVIVIPFIYNLLKRHPTCMVMIQNSAGEAGADDPFDPQQTDPLKTGAIQSSLWELHTLMLHYHPNVATLAKIFLEPFRKPNYNMEDFLDWSYKALMESEKTRKYRGMVSLLFDEHPLLFGEGGYIEGWAL